MCLKYAGLKKQFDQGLTVYSSMSVQIFKMYTKQQSVQTSALQECTYEPSSQNLKSHIWNKARHPKTRLRDKTNNKTCIYCKKIISISIICIFCMHTLKQFENQKRTGFVLPKEY